MPVAEALARIVANRRPQNVGYFCVVEPSTRMVDALFSSDITLWVVDGRRVRSLGRRSGQSCAPEPRAGEVVPAQARCANFVRASDRPPLDCANGPTASDLATWECAEYLPRGDVRIISADSARGRGAAFSTRIEEVVATARSPVETVRAALEICRTVAKVDARVAIESHSLDLAISLFAPDYFHDFPYVDFRSLLSKRFGSASASERQTRQLDELLAELRRTLFSLQTEAHLDELARVLDSERGRAYIAVRPFTGAKDRFAIHPTMPVLLQLIADRFWLDLGELELHSTLWEDSSPVFGQSFVLQPHSVGERPRTTSRRRDRNSSRRAT